MSHGLGDLLYASGLLFATSVNVANEFRDCASFGTDLAEDGLDLLDRVAPGISVPEAAQARLPIDLVPQGSYRAKGQNVSCQVSACHIQPFAFELPLVPPKERTDKEISGIIRAETATQVAKGIRDQSPAIQRSVEGQTREAVKSLQPTITSIIKSELEAQVTKSVAPVQAQMKAYQKLNTLLALARNDDRMAFDQLLSIGTDRGEDKVRTLARATVLDIVRQKVNILHRMSVQFQEKQTPESMKKILNGSKNREERLAAIDNFPESDMSIVPLLVERIRTDDHLEVVATAFRAFDFRTKQSFQFPDYPSVFSWWSHNHAAFDQNQQPK